MKIGYPCINRSIKCIGNKTFRLKSYSPERLIETINNNLACLFKMLKYNVKHQILFFRITSDLIPFASHPICDFPWQKKFRNYFEKIGAFIKKNNIRISMHPDQFIIINAKDDKIIHRSIDELLYHVDVLDLLKLDNSAKIQLHVGGVYKEKKVSIKRFISNYQKLPKKIINRLVIENDHNRYNLDDCLQISDIVSIPVLFDYFHHKIYGNNKNFKQVFLKYIKTWKTNDGIPLCDYSSQQPFHSDGTHANNIDIEDFHQFLKLTKPYDIDIMLEIKDKEKSAIKAIDIAKNDSRFVGVI